MRLGMNLQELVKLEFKMIRYGKNVDRAAQDLIAKKSEDALALIKKNSSGRPGPNVVTGDYREAWRSEVSSSGKSFRLINPSPQTNRLEYGFYGTDSMGRVYYQPPFPHIAPTVVQIRAEIREEMKELLSREWSRS